MKKMSCNLLFYRKMTTNLNRHFSREARQRPIYIGNRILISLTFRKMSQKVSMRYFILIRMTIIKK